MKNKRNLLWLLWLLPLSLLLLNGCDCCPMGGPDPLATEILDVRVEPNPVAVGSPTTFTAIIRDSTETVFRYYWSVPGGAETVVPRYTWIPMVEPGEYTAFHGPDDQYADVSC